MKEKAAKNKMEVNISLYMYTVHKNIDKGYSSKKSDGKTIKFYPWYCCWINHFYSWWVL